jgi:predicted RNA-binding protein YlqC (UPF0109 family)
MAEVKLPLTKDELVGDFISTLSSFIVRYANLLTAKPNLITVDIKETPKTVVIDVNSVDREEVAKLVGKKGTIVKSVRRLVKPSGRDIGKNVVLNVSEVDSLPQGVRTIDEWTRRFRIDATDKKFDEKVINFVKDFVRMRYDSFVYKTGKQVEFPKINSIVTDTNRIIIEMTGEPKLMGYVVGKRKVFIQHLKNVLKYAAIKELKESGVKYVVDFSV